MDKSWCGCFFNSHCSTATFITALWYMMLYKLQLESSQFSHNF